LTIRSTLYADEDIDTEELPPDVHVCQWHRRGFIVGEQATNSSYEGLTELQLLQQHAGVEALKELIYLPVYLYEHSGQTINTTGFSCNWDSGQVGYIYIYKHTVRDMYKVQRVSTKLRETVEKHLSTQWST
jgi:hypothetical protein